MSTPSVDRLGADDAASMVAALAFLYERTPPGADRAAEVLSGEDNVFVLARLDTEPVGYGFGHILDRLDGRRALFIYEVQTAHRHRRRGVASAVIRTMLGVANARGCAKAFLFTERSNEAAVRLYRSLGAAAPHDDDVAFSWQLPSTSFIH